MTESNPLMEYVKSTGGQNLSKWCHYFDIYHRHFQKFRGRKVTVLEIGVFQGGSLRMWEDYFGDRARIIGVDIDRTCKKYENERTKIHIGDQEDREFLARIREDVGPLDVLIDDGGHTMNQQIVSFEELYEMVIPGGVYLVEDVHTSYWRKYGGGTGDGSSFIDYTKKLVDQLNAWHSENQDMLSVNEFTKTTASMHFYDSVVVFEKERVSKPMEYVHGKKRYRMATPAVTKLK